MEIRRCFAILSVERQRVWIIRSRAVADRLSHREDKKNLLLFLEDLL